MASTIAALLGGEDNHYDQGAQDPVIHIQQMGHPEMGGQTNSASTGRNEPIPATHPLTGTVLPEKTGAGGGKVHRGGRGRGN